jgi:hypothetical protein
MRSEILSAIDAERDRQIAKGYDSAHDTSHVRGELAAAAATFAWIASTRSQHMTVAMWPWSSSLPRREDDEILLIKAGALIVAELERIAGSHHSQRVTAAELAAVRAMISDPIEVRELPTLGGGTPRPAPPITELPPADCPPIRDWISELPKAACGILEEHRTIDEMSETIRRQSGKIETLREALKSANRDINSLHSELDTRYRERKRILDLLTVENDGPEGQMPPSWLLGQVRQIIGITSEHDAETLDLRDPEWPEPTWQQTAENLREALAQTTDERDRARREVEEKVLVIRDHQRREAVANQCFDILIAARLINRLPESQDLKMQLLREGCQRAATMRFHFEQIRAILGAKS